jgi:hypothetical protein
MIHASVLEEIDQFGESIGTDEDCRLTQVPDPVLVDEPSVFVDPVSSTDSLSPYENIESIRG